MKKLLISLLFLTTLNALNAMAGSVRHNGRDVIRIGSPESAVYMAEKVAENKYINDLEMTLKIYRLRVAHLAAKNKELKADRDLFLKVLSDSNYSKISTNKVVDNLKAEAVVVSESLTNKVTKVMLFIDGEPLTIMIDRKKSK